MSGSELDFSESSNSVQSATDSAYSSPTHQGPYGGITGVKNVMSIDDKSAYLRIILEPDMYARIRYEKELQNSTHGCLLGRDGPKTYPTVELVNYTGKAVIMCHLVQDKNNDLHPHRLVTENLEWDSDISKEVPENGSYKVCFSGMLIVHTPKKNVVEMLVQRNVSTSRSECIRLANKINLKIVRLRFSAYDIVTKQVICPPVYSEPINDSKSPDTNKLEICRYNRCFGRPRGGDDMFFFVEKIKSNNIRIRFFELNNQGERIWSTEVGLIEKEVHKQYGIFFRTPPYRDTEITSNIKVFMELFRPSDGQTSSPKKFIYKAENFRNKTKRSASAPTSSVAGATVQGVAKMLKIEVLPEEPATRRNANQVPQTPRHQIVAIQSASTLQGASMFQSTMQPTQMGASILQGRMHSGQSGTPMVQGGIQTAENLMQIIEQNNTVQFQQDSGLMPQDGMQSVLNSVPQYPQDRMPEVELQQLQMVHHGVVHAPLGTGAQLPYSPESKNNGIVDDSIIDEYLLFPTPHQSRENSIEFATAQPSDSESYSNSSMINDPMLGRGADPALIAIEEEIVLNLGAGAIDSQELPNFATMDFDEYFGSGFSLLNDSGRASVTSNLTKKHQGVSGESSKKPKNEQNNEYTAYYKAEDGIEVKKLIKEICEIIKMEVYKKQDVRCKLERLFELRLSNGDTFLHMALVCNIASFEYITRIIHSMRMPHLLNLTNDLQQTILHLAVINDLPLVVNSLLDKGCDPMLPDMNGNNAIHHAVMCQSSLNPFVSFDLNAHNFEKQTALHLAAIYDLEESTRILLQKGASYNARDMQGRTPLHLAVYDDRLNVTRALLDFIVTSDIEAVDGLGYTALQIVTSGEIRENTLEILKLLLQKKADPMYYEGDNRPPWKLARRKPQMWQIMKEYVPPALDDYLSSECSDDEFESADEGDSDEITTKLVEMKLEDKQAVTEAK